MKLLSVDPGKNACGWAYWEDSVLKAVGYEPWQRIFIGPPDVVVIEFPRATYNQRKKGVNDNDLLEVAYAAGAVVGTFPRASVTRYTPQEWKGSAPKAVTEHRARLRLVDDEIELVEEIRRAQQNHVWDAVGIGLTYLKRPPKSGSPLTSLGGLARGLRDRL